MEREHHSSASRARPDRRKKSGRRPRRILGMWARVTLLVAAVGVLGFIMFGLITKALRPYLEARVQKGQMSTTQGQIARLDRENADLRRRIAYLKTPDGMTTEARKMGYVKPGEIPIIVEGQTPAPGISPAPPPPAAAPPPAREGSRARRLWRRIIGH